MADRETEDQEAERIGRQPPPGVWKDGELVTIEPGQPLPPTRILAPDGTELTAEEASLYDEAADDDAGDVDLDAMSVEELDTLIEAL